MLVDDILQGAGLTQNKTYKETRFITPPKETYAIFNQSYERRGADLYNCLKEYDVTIEIYSLKPDEQMERNIEAEFDKRSIFYTKQERYFIQSEQLYQVIYEFSYLEKGE